VKKPKPEQKTKQKKKISRRIQKNRLSSDFTLLKPSAQSDLSNCMEISPTSTSERIGSLDFLRGIAILGILVINIESFCYPDPWSPSAFGFKTSMDENVRFWVYFLTQGKSFSMLALLFGIGFYIFIERLQLKGEGVRAFDLYARRLLWLFVFGAIHAYLIWDGDILYHYAVCGFLIFPFRLIDSKQLFLILLIPIALLLLNAYQYTSYTKNQYVTYLEKIKMPENERTEDDKKAIEVWENKLKKIPADTSKIETPRNTYFESIKENAKHTELHRGKIFYFGLFFRTLIMMILGIILYRSGIFTNYKSFKFYWPVTLLILLIALLINYFRYHHWTYHYFEPVTNFWTEWLYTFPKESLGLAYILLFNGLYQKFFKHTRIKLISKVGQSALSNYILQSIVCGVIFYGYGFGMFNHYSRSQLLIIVLSIWILQIAATYFWLRKFKHGPLEWIWRKLTYSSFK
jgi:uncharacterized protein